jgi:hypothetical protein
MQDRQKNLDRDIPADVQHLRDEDIGARYRYFFEERGLLHRSIRDLISQGANIEPKLTKEFVDEPCSQDSAGTERAGFLPRLIEALHHSRRLQAARVIRSYRHLIDPACEDRVSGNPTERSLDMSSNKAPLPATKAWSSPAVRILVAAVVFGFVVFHIVGDAVLRSPLPAAKADMSGLNKYGD